MLIRFNVKNTYSFSSGEDGNSEEFSMIAGKVRSKKDHVYDDGRLKLLKFAAVYGANAAGKSNLVKAMELMRRIVLTGLPDGHTEKYCKVNPENKNRPSYFEIEVKLGEKYYSYGFEIILSQSRFLSEWLVELHPDNSDKELFTRDISGGNYLFGGELSQKELKNKLDVYAEDISNDSSVLFLTVMNQNKRNLYTQYRSASILQDVYLWFQSAFDIVYPDRLLSSYAYLSETAQTDNVCKLIAAFGTGISGYEVVDVSLDKVLRGLTRQLQEKILTEIEKHQVEVRNSEEIRSINMVMRTSNDFFIVTVDDSDRVQCQTIEFRHGEKETLFRLNEESDGTVRILDLLEILLAGEGKTYVVDELDRCLHPSLSYKFVEAFFEAAASKNIQLIVTTHESRLMDFDLLRRDEIWFVDKKQTGESDIYSLEEYNARFDQKIDKAYLEGRYGGVPVFSTIFPIREG